MPTAISATDVLVVWGASWLALAAVYLLAVLGVYVLVRTRKTLAFRQDVLHKLEKRQMLPSGKEMRLSYLYLLAALSLDNGAQATLLYRVSNYLAMRRMRPAAEVVHAIAKFITHIDISPWARIGPGLSFDHGMGAVIGKLTHLGSRVTICQGVTTGHGRPRIGDDVTLWAGAKVIGDVEIGPRSQVGANAVVLDDVPADRVAVGVPVTRYIPLDASRQG